ncbi:MAG: RNA 2',3'-cyclic phosphodiesterase [Candidatus Anstonellales archaeon]
MRLFIGIDLPEEIKEKVFALEMELPKESIKPVVKENLHITIKFIGEKENANETIAALGKVKNERIEVSIKGVGAFPNMNYINVVWVGAEGSLEPLVRKIENALGMKNERFYGHITIARVRKRIDAKKFFEKHKNDEFGSFVAKSFVLYKSILTPQGPIYEKLKEFEFVG